MLTGVSAPGALVLICARNDLFSYNRISWRRGCVRGMSDVCHPLRIQFPAANQRRDEAKNPPISSNFRAKTVARSDKFFHGTDVPRMRLQLKMLFGIKALPICKKTGKNLLGEGGGVDATPTPPQKIKLMTCTRL